MTSTERVTLCAGFGRGDSELSVCVCVFVQCTTHARTQVCAFASLRALCSLPSQGAAEAGDRAAGLDVFKDSQTVKINPDKPQEQCRFRTLEVSVKATTQSSTSTAENISVPDGQCAKPNAADD